MKTSPAVEKLKLHPGLQPSPLWRGRSRAAIAAAVAGIPVLASGRAESRDAQRLALMTCYLPSPAPAAMAMSAEH